MADLANLDVKKVASKPATLSLDHPTTGEPLVNEDGTPWTIDLISSDSDEYKKVQQRQTNLLIRKAGRGKAKTDAVTIENDSIDRLVACTKGWKGLVEEGKSLEFSSTAAEELYRKYPWIREQVETFILDRANYLGN